MGNQFNIKRTEKYLYDFGNIVPLDTWFTYENTKTVFIYMISTPEWSVLIRWFIWEKGHYRFPMGKIDPGYYF